MRKKKILRFRINSHFVAIQVERFPDNSCTIITRDLLHLPIAIRTTVRLLRAGPQRTNNIGLVYKFQHGTGSPK